MTGTDTRIASTIMPDYGGAYGWVNREWEATKPGVGPCHAGTEGWYGDHPISDELHQAFARWQAAFASGAGGWPEYQNFDWAAFHATGIVLTTRLKAELEPTVRVFYCKPYEDPVFRDDPNAWGPHKVECPL